MPVIVETKMPVIAENIKRVAVEMNGQQPQLIQLDQKRPLTAVIKDLCNEWALSEHSIYALQFNESNKKAFITEQNRGEIQNGNVLRLTFSGAKFAQDICDKLLTGPDGAWFDALKNLSELSQDVTFAQEFINRKGLHQLISMISKVGTCTGESLSYTLKSFLELMEHGIVSWDVLEHDFIKNVASFVTVRSTMTNDSTLQSALDILESLVTNSTGKYALNQELSCVNLINHFESSNIEIQTRALALCNAMFLKADHDSKIKIAAGLQSKQIRNIILNNVIQGRPANGIDTDMAHHLHVFQSMLMNQLDYRKNMKIESVDQAIKEIAEMRRVAYESDTESVGTPVSRRANHAKDHKVLGFQNISNPVEDFNQVPPGVLALDNMAYFFKNYQETFTKVVLENSCRADEHDCPFAKACIELTNMLCNILKVGEPISEEENTYHAFFFTHDHPFEELFCMCIQLLNKTWKEMRATSEDFAKVMSVVKEQITRGLRTQPSTFEQLRIRLYLLTYGEINNIWQQERRHKEEGEATAKPIKELRKQITPEILELIKQQRLNHIVEGTRFSRYSKSNNRNNKGKYWFCRLSPNHKFMHYGDCDENAKPSIESLQYKIPVMNIQNLAIGKDCQHMKDRDKRKAAASSNAYSIVYESEGSKHLDFIAPNEKEFSMWTDGINVLIGNAMTSDLTNDDLEILLSMEIKLRLLDIEGISIPEEPPPIPKEPPNYDFNYEL